MIDKTHLKSIIKQLTEIHDRMYNEEDMDTLDNIKWLLERELKEIDN